MILLRIKTLIGKGLDKFFIVLFSLLKRVIRFSLLKKIFLPITIIYEKLSKVPVSQGGRKKGFGGLRKPREIYLKPKKKTTYRRTKNNYKVLFDLTQNMSWGDKSIMLPYIAWVVQQRKKSNFFLITANWNNPIRFYNKRKYLYNPNKEPVDFFKNLIVPSLGLKDYYDMNSGIGNLKVDTQKYNLIFTGFNVRTFIWARNVVQFEYKIAEDQITEDYSKVKEILKKTKNLVIYATWDDEMKYEHAFHWTRKGIVSMRHRGLGLTDEKFEDLVNLVKRIDEYCVKNPDCRIILFSKKAQGWSKLLKSDFFDFRMFEQYNLSFSQAFHLIVDNCVASIGQTCSMQLWINNERRMNHITYIDSLQSTYKEEMVKYGWPLDKKGSIVFALKYFSLDGYNKEIKDIFE